MADLIPSSFGGFEIRCCRHMVGEKFAVKCGNVLAVSPAMYSLISTAEGDELKQILMAIRVREIPEWTPADMRMYRG